MAFIGDLNEKMDQIEDRSYDPIPEGWYTAEAKKVDLVDTKSGTGKRMNIEFAILGPEYVGRRVFAGLNIRNQNEKAEQIALQDLKAIKSSLGIVNLRDTDELIGKPLQIKVSVKPADGQYDARNDIKGYKAIDGGTLPAPAPKPAPSIGQQAKPAWLQPPKQQEIPQEPKTDTSYLN